MKVVAYSIKSSEKEPLALANHKKHEITLISNVLSIETVNYATGKEAVIVFEGDDVSAAVISKLAELGVKYIATRSSSTSHIDQDVAAVYGIRLGSVPPESLSGLAEDQKSTALAEETILNLDKWQQKQCLGNSCVCSRSCDRANDFISTETNQHHHEH